jgi:hypothetical protein
MFETVMAFSIPYLVPGIDMDMDMAPDDESRMSDTRRATRTRRLRTQYERYEANVFIDASNEGDPMLTKQMVENRHINTMRVELGVSYRLMWTFPSGYT